MTRPVDIRIHAVSPLFTNARSPSQPSEGARPPTVRPSGGRAPSDGCEGDRALVNSGDTAWILMSTGLVMLMTPGLAFFYGGLVRTKNVLSTIMHSWFILALVSVTWVVFGYTLAFGPSQG